MEIDDAWIEKLRAELPELPQAKKQRYMAAYGLSDYDAYMVSSDKGFYPFFEAAVSDGAPAKTVANWILGDISRILKERGLDTDAIPFDGKSLHELIELIESKAISNTIAKQVLAFMFDGEGSPKKIVEARQLAQISDTGAITELVQSVIDQNPQAIEDFKAGKKKAMGFLTGQVMRASRGKANPAMINQILTDLLSKLS